MSTKERAMESNKGLPGDGLWREIEALIHLLAEVNTACEEHQRLFLWHWTLTER